MVSLLSGWLLVGAVCPSPPHKCVKRLAWPVALLLGWVAARVTHVHLLHPLSRPSAPKNQTMAADLPPNVRFC